MLGKLQATILLVNHAMDFVQILVHGSKYTCPMTRRDGKAVFRFKDKWYSVNDYISEMTRYLG